MAFLEIEYAIETKEDGPAPNKWLNKDRQFPFFELGRDTFCELF
jgi:hypothetical protein